MNLSGLFFCFIGNYAEIGWNRSYLLGHPRAIAGTGVSTVRFCGRSEPLPYRLYHNFGVFVGAGVSTVRFCGRSEPLPYRLYPSSHRFCRGDHRSSAGEHSSPLRRPQKPPPRSSSSDCRDRRPRLSFLAAVKSALFYSININSAIFFYISQARGFLRFLHRYRPEENPYLQQYQSICRQIRFPADCPDTSAYRREISLFLRWAGCIPN